MSKVKTNIIITRGESGKECFQKAKADTVIAFTIDDAKEFMDNNKSLVDCKLFYVGEHIPDPVLPEIISKLVISTVEKYIDNKVVSSCSLDEIALNLHKYSQNTMDGMSRNEKIESFNKYTDELFEKLRTDSGK